MRLASSKQHFQDWFTQQWAILWGRRIIPGHVSWLMGPFGKPGIIADDFVYELAENEGLIIQRDNKKVGLITSVKKLNLPENDLKRLSAEVIYFYENTGEFSLSFQVKWNPLFKFLGRLVNAFFSKRIDQLNVPMKNSEGSKQIKSEIITLSDPVTGNIKYTVWYRTFKMTSKVLYSGVYSICKLPAGQNCIKAVFPLPNGNATVIMSPMVGKNGELCLKSYGGKFSEPGFYFLLNDAKGEFWAQYISSFRDQLVVSCYEGNLQAQQTLTLWGLKVVQFNYYIQKTNQPCL